MTSHSTLHDRADDLGRKLDGLCAGVATGRDLADLQARHADLCRRLRDLQGPQAPEPQAVDALKADFEGLAQSVERWIERQDAKAGR